MTRSKLRSYTTRPWSGYVLYTVAVGTVAAACAGASARLTTHITATAAAEGRLNAPRQLSRVERHLLERARAAVRLPSPPPAEVVAMVRPVMPPAEMASALDRIESTDAADVGAENMVSSERTLQVASCDGAVCSKPQVRGWRKSGKAKGPGASRMAGASGSMDPGYVDAGSINAGSINPGDKDTSSVKFDASGRRLAGAGKVGAGKAGSAKLASSKTPPGKKLAFKSPAYKQLAVKQTAGKLLAGKMSLQPAVAAAYIDVAPSSETINFVRAPFARTPGDIIRISLLGSS